jgi:hypothetical protein
MEDQPDPREFVRRIRRERALRLMVIRQARLERVALIASYHERVVNG